MHAPAQGYVLPAVVDTRLAEANACTDTISAAQDPGHTFVISAITELELAGIVFVYGYDRSFRKVLGRNFKGFSHIRAADGQDLAGERPICSDSDADTPADVEIKAASGQRVEGGGAKGTG